MDKKQDSNISMALLQRQTIIEQAKFEQDLARIDRVMRARQAAFALATEVVKNTPEFTLDKIFEACRKIEKYLSEGSEEYLALAKKLNDLDEAQDKMVLEQANKS